MPRTEVTADLDCNAHNHLRLFCEDSKNEGGTFEAVEVLRDWRELQWESHAFQRSSENSKEIHWITRKHADANKTLRPFRWKQQQKRRMFRSEKRESKTNSSRQREISDSFCVVATNDHRTFSFCQTIVINAFMIMRGNYHKVNMCRHRLRIQNQWRIKEG